MQVRPLSVLAHPDFSDFLVHFTGRGGATRAPLRIQRLSAGERLASILTERRVRAFKVFGFDDEAVCLSESTARGVQHLIKEGRYGPHGIVFEKQFVFDNHGSPALYVRGDEWASVAEWPVELRAKAVRYWPGAVGESLPRHLEARSEWVGEREWRVVRPSGALRFTYEDVAFLIVPSSSWVEKFASTMQGEQAQAVLALPFVVIERDGVVTARRPDNLDAFAMVADDAPAESAQDMFDTDWRRETLLDERSQSQAQRLLDAIGGEEYARRSDSDLIAAQLRPARAKYALDTPEPDECPVCGVKALAVETFDQWGGNLGPGTCLICGYYRSEFIADQAAIDEHIAQFMSDDS